MDVSLLDEVMSQVDRTAAQESIHRDHTDDKEEEGDYSARYTLTLNLIFIHCTESVIPVSEVTPRDIRFHKEEEREKEVVL